MLSAIDAANFFIELFCHGEENDLTNMKVNKLLYYAQGHSYERLGRPLFPDPIEAWENGPVVNTVYQKLRQYGGGPISESIHSYEAHNPSDEETELLLDVAREYGQYSAATLRNMTHRPGSPWAKTYTGEYHTEIPDAIIAEHFQAQPKLPTFAIDPDMDTIGHVEDDCLVVPKEFFDDWTY